MRKKHEVTVTYDMEEHLQMKKWMIGCFAVMFCFWILAWYLDWQTALVSMLANGYFCAGIYFAFKLYPPRKD